MQQVSLIIAYACIFDRTCLRKAELRLGSEGASVEDVLDTLRDLLLTLRSSAASSVSVLATDGDSTGDTAGSADLDAGDGDIEPEEVEYQKVLTQWSAALSAIILSEA